MKIVELFIEDFFRTWTLFKRKINQLMEIMLLDDIKRVDS